MLPTPQIKYLNHKTPLDSGGLIEEGDVYLSNIPANKYSEEFLFGATDNADIKRYWVIHGPGLEPKAYITDNIDRANPILFNVVIKRFNAINTDELKTILGLEEDLNQQEVDNRILALVRKGALKTSQAQDASPFVFSKSFALSLPGNNEYIIFDRSTDGSQLTSEIEILNSPAGEVPNILSIEENGGPWGIRFDDSEFSCDALEKIIPEITANFPYDSGNNEFEQTITIKGNVTAEFEYVQVRETDQTRNGRFFITWPTRSVGSSLSKTIKAVRVTVGSNDPIDVPVIKDNSVSNAFALVSSPKLTEDPPGLSGTGQVTMKINFIYSDDTLAYGNNGVEYNQELREADLKYSWDTYAGPTSDNLQKLITVEKYHYDFDTSNGFDIELNNFNFLTSLEGSNKVSGNANRASNINVCRINLILKRHDAGPWLPGTYRVKVHRQQEGIEPYLHDFQFKNGITS